MVLYIGKTEAMGRIHVVKDSTIMDAEPGDIMVALCNAKVTSIYTNQDRLPVRYSGPILEDPRLCPNCKFHAKKGN